MQCVLLLWASSARLKTRARQSLMAGKCAFSTIAFGQVLGTDVVFTAAIVDRGPQSTVWWCVFAASLDA